ncbi:hypothetical protein Scep_011013 [Stephania cephalantha]|uniref:Uncharacterized protein n=1 Tax=Stephania cephalantha TaxID=152367 RepID=A0AAP0JYM9_9MAGN
MDGDLRLSNRSRTDETDATPIGSSVEDERDRSEGVADCVSGGIADDAKTSEVDSCVVEVDRAGFEDVESGLGFRSSDFLERKEMAGTVVESGGVVGEDEKYLEESAVEVLVDGGEVEVMDCCSNGDVVQQDEVHNVLDSSTAKPDVVVSVDDSRSDGIKMVSCFQSGEITSDSNNSSEIHGFSGVDGARKVTELQIVMESKSDQSAVVVVKEGKDCVMNCSFTVSGDGISAGSMPKEFAELDKKGTVSSWVNSNQEMNGKEKRAGRKGNGMNKVSGMNGNGNFGLRKCGGSKRTYLRKEMEALRYVNVEEQQKTWNKVHLGLGDVVARLLDTMGMVKPLNNGRRNNYRQNIENQKQKGPILRMVATYGRGNLPTNHFAVRNLIQANCNG